MDMVIKFLPSGVFFLLTVSFGIWLSRTGKPYNGLLFNVHKLVALGVLIFTVVKFVDATKSTQIQGFLIMLLIVAGICVLALFTSGALMSAGNPAARNLLVVHQIAPVLLSIVMVAAVFLLGTKAL
jgi:hypothetical protein